MIFIMSWPLFCKTINMYSTFPNFEGTCFTNKENVIVKLTLAFYLGCKQQKGSQHKILNIDTNTGVLFKGLAPGKLAGCKQSFAHLP